MEKTNEEKVIVKDLKTYERILFLLFKKTFIKVYNSGRITAINAILK